eukprot:TRINITY_DN2864_c0_g1_i2.p1 TRINITY_DN2864_c0_g1~~TRINITY_DN2864_c0_g1_i2.p1  ORF type:complete len:119 (-),score=65.60 TRINITY_DN2864_c0_g1_i2:68-424(-)
MIRRPPRSTQSRSSAASDVYKRQGINAEYGDRKSLRISSVTACSETARFTPISAPQRSISGTMPEVDRVMRRFDRPRPSPSMAIIMARFTSVSYTHLRAHETVLDLVCRLLLEKKKKK